jgi:hypothetical protein
MRSKLLYTVMIAALVMASAIPTTAAASSSSRATSGTCRVVNVRSGEHSRGQGANLQAAIDAADPGDRLRIRGICHGSFALNIKLTLVGKATPRFPHATLDGDDAGRVLESTSGGELRSIVIRHGRARSGGGILNTGGILTLTGQTRVRGNHAGWGGGISLSNGRVILADRTVVQHNVAKNSGGGVYIDYAGKLVVRDDAQVRGNRSGGDGGGVTASIGVVTLRGRAWVHGNQARGSGGGIANLDGWSWFWNQARVTGNTAVKEGGGVFVYYGSGGVCSPGVQLSPNVPDDPPSWAVGC